MRTKYFAQATIDSAEVEKDVGVVRRLRQEQLDELQTFLGSAHRLIQRDESMHDDVRETLTRTGVSGEAYARVRRLCLFLVEAHEKFDDEPAALIADLDELVALGGEVRAFLLGLEEQMRQVAHSRRRERLARRTFPGLVGISYACDVRVDLPDFDVFNDDPQTREAEPREWIPLVVLRFSTDEEDELRCQVDLPYLRRAIKVLQAAESDLTRLTARLQTLHLPTAPLED